MAEYITKEQACDAVDKRIDELRADIDIVKQVYISGVKKHIESIPATDVTEKEMILDFIEDNRPTDVQTDWERGCAYICDEIEKLLK